MHTSPQQNTYQYYKDVHRRMLDQYVDNNHQDDANALELQSFLSQIKILGRKDSPGTGLISQSAITIWNRATKLANKTKKVANTLLNEKGGANLEKDLTSIILATLPEKVTEQIDKKQINIGAKHFNLGVSYAENEFNNLIEDSDIVNALKDLRSDLRTYSTKNSIFPIKIKSIPGKIDVAGPGYILSNIEFEIEDANIKKYYTLLKDATFTAKNYASESNFYSKEMKKYYIRDLNADFPNLHLGNSDPYRAVFSSLSFLGYSKEVIQAAFYAGYWRLRYKNTESDEIGTHLWHLRFAYELTGAGSYYIDQALSKLNGGAKYLIYNDPTSSNISVCSTKKIINGILQQDSYTGNPLTDAIVISKQHVRNLSRG